MGDPYINEWLPDAKNLLPNYFTRKDSKKDERRYTDGILVYLHLNKAAGSTTKSCLSKVARKRSVSGSTAVLSSTARVQIQKKLEHKVNYNILMGGYAFGICDAAMDKNCSYFTILRDPYERLLSSFTYCRRAGTDQTCQGLSPWDVTLKEWAIHQGSYFFRQLLMKPYFCNPNQHYTNWSLNGIPHSKGTTFSRSPCWFREKVILNRSLSPALMDNLLTYCVEHLEEWFSVIGLTDHYDLTLAMLEKVYQIPFQKACTGSEINVSNYHNLANDTNVNKTETVSDWKRELQEDSEVYEALRGDIVIYEKAKQIFERQKLAFFARK
nr:uncharacterized protein LOC129254212 [Lytechinus pictus]